jgi:hypothetical protein
MQSPASVPTEALAAAYKIHTAADGNPRRPIGVSPSRHHQNRERKGETEEGEKKEEEPPLPPGISAKAAPVRRRRRNCAARHHPDVLLHRLSIAP